MSITGISRAKIAKPGIKHDYPGAGTWLDPIKIEVSHVTITKAPGNQIYVLFRKVKYGPMPVTSSKGVFTAKWHITDDAKADTTIFSVKFSLTDVWKQPTH
jgi:hypothetical protein